MMTTLSLQEISEQNSFNDQWEGWSQDRHQRNDIEFNALKCCGTFNLLIKLKDFSEEDFDIL